MLGKGFFNVKPSNPNPYFNPVIVDLSGAQKFEEDTIFVPGKYKIEVAPGGFSNTKAPFMEYIETITQPFIVRAYCGSDGTANGPGTNPYSGPFKVNGVTSVTNQPGIDVNHIFGAGGGNGYVKIYSIEHYMPGGGNCLGNGAQDNLGILNQGAGSCLHLLPVGGIFGTNYLRAYHMCSPGHTGSAYGGAAGAVVNGSAGQSSWATRGGNSPYGNGGQGSASYNFASASGTGIGSARYVLTPDNTYALQSAGAYFDGTNWIDAPGVNGRNDSSYIRITYLEPLV